MTIENATVGATAGTQTEIGPAELSHLVDVSDATITRLHRQLEDRAEHDGTLDVSYRTIDSPIGPLLLASTEQGLVRVAFAREGLDTVLATLAVKVSPRILASAKRLDPVASQLDEYFAGRRRAFELPLDLRLAHGFRRTVLDHLVEIGFGRTASYTQVAAAAGRPTAVRAVGTACATNPLPIVVPCHRVLRSDGSLGGYLGGLDSKQALLRLEAA
jgi:methylated-DNA-[protein]-cysteine S-methyltransferase